MHIRSYGPLTRLRQPVTTVKPRKTARQEFARYPCGVVSAVESSITNKTVNTLTGTPQPVIVSKSAEK